MCKKIETSLNQRSDAIASQRNQSYWNGWLASLEMEIESRKEVDRPLTDAACYVSWLLLSAEYIVYRLRWYFYVAGSFENAQIFNEPYGTLLDMCKVMPTEIREHVQFAVTVRHIFVHKGFPNPQAEPTRRTRKLCSGEVFSKADVREIRDQIENPATYEKVKLKFHAVHSWLNKHTPDITFGA